jgi:hypothetical protein
MQWFAMPNAAAVNPYALGQPSLTDLTIWSAIELFAESKFITVFSMLFGAGVVLMTARLESSRSQCRTRALPPDGVAAGLRTVHAYVLWHGDILVLYASADARLSAAPPVGDGRWRAGYRCHGRGNAVFTGGQLVVASPGPTKCVASGWPTGSRRELPSPQRPRHSRRLAGAGAVARRLLC